MRRLLMATGIAGLLLVHRSETQQSERIYPIFELTDEDVALIDLKDGSIDDWLEVLGEPTLAALDFLTRLGLGPNDPASLDFRIWLAWHDATDRIVVAIERADNAYVNRFDRQDTYEASMFRQDCIEFMVDGDRNGGPFYFNSTVFDSQDEWRLAQNQSAQHYGALPEVYDEGPNLQSMAHRSVSNQGAWFITPPFADGGGGVFGDNPVISVTEFYVTAFDYFIWNDPAESVISRLHPGKIIGFAMEVLDVDIKPGVWQSSHYLRSRGYEDTGAAFFSSDTFVQGFLVGPGGEVPPGISAVESVTWGRIKAQFVE